MFVSSAILFSYGSFAVEFLRLPFQKLSHMPMKIVTEPSHQLGCLERRLTVTAGYPAAHLCNTPHASVYILSMAAFVLQWQS